MKDFINFFITLLCIICIVNYCKREDKKENFSTISVRTVKKTYVELDSLWKNTDINKK